MKMQFCPYCGTKLDDGARFCKNCGESMVQSQQATETATFHEPPKTETQQPKAEPVKEDPRTKRKTVYDGELHKCPNCGELLKSFTTVCPTCAYELRGVHTNSPVEALAKRVEMASSLDDKIELITNFYIPNTKEDIMEFMILAASNIDVKKGVDDDVTKAWISKLDQVYQRAEISMGGHPDFAQIKSIYDRKKKELKNKKIKGFLIGAGCVAGWFFLIGLLWNPAATIAISIGVLVLVIIGAILFKKR